MKNVIEIEGYVTSKIWEWDQDVLFRLCNYPSQEVPRPRGGVYVTVRVPRGELNNVPIGVRPQQRLVVTGWLASRDYIHSLTDFLVRARQRGAESPAPMLDVDLPFDPGEMVEQRSLNEVIATSLRIVPDEEGVAAPPEPRRIRQRGRRKPGNDKAESVPAGSMVSTPITGTTVTTDTTVMAPYTSTIVDGSNVSLPAPTSNG